jgi:polyhydroxyalkanoate synthesis regulator phasin
MPLASKASRLPEPLREALARLWFERRYSLDQLLGYLKSLADGDRSSLPPELADAPEITPQEVPGRSGLHDHLHGEVELADQIRRSRMNAEALAREFGDVSDEKLARLNFQSLHTAIHDLFCAAAKAKGKDAGDQVAIDAKSAMQLAIALEKTEAAIRKHIDSRVQVRKEMAEELDRQVKDVEAEAARRPMTPQEALDRVRAVYRGEG